MRKSVCWIFEQVADGKMTPDEAADWLMGEGSAWSLYVWLFGVVVGFLIFSFLK